MPAPINHFAPLATSLLRAVCQVAFAVESSLCLVSQRPKVALIEEARRRQQHWCLLSLAEAVRIYRHVTAAAATVLIAERASFILRAVQISMLTL